MRKLFLFLIILMPMLANRTAAQDKFTPLTNWLEDNTAQMGGRAILMVYKDGQIVYSHSVDKMNMRQRMVDKYVARRQGKEADLSAYTPTSRVAIASCSKWYSAALIMTFIDEGKLKLTDTVGKFLPVLTQHGKGGTTISECLSHLTGIKAPELKESINEVREAKSMDETIANIAEMPMEGLPGKVFHYSNVGLQIAGAVIEKISGKTFEQLFAERIAHPLNMQNTDFGKGPVALPAGGAFSTPNDYINFLVMILNKGVFNGKRILRAQSVATMQVNRITPDVKIGYSPAEAGNFGYGYGEWVMESSPVDHVSTTVTSPGLFGSFPWVDNSRHYAAFLMTFYIKNDGRNARYKELKKLTDTALSQ